MLMLNKEEKDHLFLILMDSLEAVDLLVCALCFYTVGLPTGFFVGFVGALPFVLMCLAFFKTMDIFAKKGMMKKGDVLLIAFFFLDVVAYIVFLFLLH